MEINRCVNCMSDKYRPGSRYCPACGFDHQSVEQPLYALKLNSILQGRYLIGRVLGQGGFGITYVGWDMVLDIKVAIKEYFPMGMVTRQDASPALLWNPSQLVQNQRQSGCNSFLKEARKMARIDENPTIVRVRDTFYENETAYIIMDFVEGDTLKEKLQKGGPIEYGECLKMLRPMMEGLAKVHKQGMIHRDISPDNIIVQPNGNVKLLDLGAAKDMSVSNGQTSQVVAKAGFSPAEQYLDNGNIGPWTDVYALCATIFYCITGRVLPSATERMCGQQDLNIDVPGRPLEESVIQALKDGLAIKENERIRCIEDLLERLNQQTNPTSGGEEGAAAGQEPGAAFGQQTASGRQSGSQSSQGASSQQPGGQDFSGTSGWQSGNQAAGETSGQQEEKAAGQTPETAQKLVDKRTGLILAAVGAAAFCIVAAVMASNTGGGSENGVRTDAVSNNQEQQNSSFDSDNSGNSGTSDLSEQENQQREGLASEAGEESKEQPASETDNSAAQESTGLSKEDIQKMLDNGELTVANNADSQAADEEDEEKPKPKKKKEKEEKSTKESSQEDEYILPEIAERVYTMDELEKLSAHELYLARNELYARHGYQFNKEDLKMYFGEKSWYTPTKTEVHDKELNEYEIANRELIMFMEEKIK